MNTGIRHTSLIHCGTCKVPLITDKVTYQREYSAAIAANEVLLCCAVLVVVEGDNMVKLAL